MRELRISVILLLAFVDLSSGSHRPPDAKDKQHKDTKKAEPKPHAAPVNAKKADAKDDKGEKDKKGEKDGKDEKKDEVSKNALAEQERKDHERQIQYLQSSAITLSTFYGTLVNDILLGRGTRSFWLQIDCRGKDIEKTWQLDPPVSMCPFLSQQSQCGVIDKTTYVFEDTTTLCTGGCASQLDTMWRAQRLYNKSDHKNKRRLFADVAYRMLRQYCVVCRPGCSG